MSTMAKTPDTSFIHLEPDVHTEPYWAAAREHRLVAAKCAACGHFVMPPTGYCPKCRGTEMEWVELSGRATLYTYTVVRHAVIPAVVETLPYVIGIVKLPDADDTKMITNIIECDVDELKIGQELEVVWHEQSEDVTLPLFRPVAG